MVLKYTPKMEKNSSIISWKDFPPGFFDSIFQVSFQRSFGEAQGIFFEEHFGMMFFFPLCEVDIQVGWVGLEFALAFGLDCVIWLCGLTLMSLGEAQHFVEIALLVT